MHRNVCKGQDWLMYDVNLLLMTFKWQCILTRVFIVNCETVWTHWCISMNVVENQLLKAIGYHNGRYLAEFLMGLRISKQENTF